MLPVEPYRGEDALRNDRAAVLRGTWQFVGHDSMLPQAGVYRGGVLSPKHEAGVAWFQDRIAKALDLPKPPKPAAVG